MCLQGVVVVVVIVVIGEEGRQLWECAFTSMIGVGWAHDNKNGYFRLLGYLKRAGVKEIWTSWCKRNNVRYPGRLWDQPMMKAVTAFEKRKYSRVLPLCKDALETGVCMCVCVCVCVCAGSRACSSFSMIFC